MLYHESIRVIKEETKLNIVAWCSNNKGNGKNNLHVAILKDNIERSPTFKQQKDILFSAYVSHWKGQCSVQTIKKALGII